MEAMTPVAIPAGTWIFEWEYVKDGVGSVGFDTVWLDDVTFPGGVTENFEQCSGLSRQGPAAERHGL